MRGVRGIFVIQEFRQLGGVTSEAPDGERFEWTADGDPANVNGGSHAIPKRPWSLPGKLRTVRTDYPGAKKASAQVLGPMRGSSTLEGRWDDRYNFDGYAVAEKRRFEEMCERGNPVRIQYDAEVFECLIVDWTCEYHRTDYIRYSFTVDNYGRPEDGSLTDRSPTTVPSAPQAFDDANVLAQIMLAEHARAPASAIKGASKFNVDTALKSLTVNMNKLADVLDTRSGALKPIGEFKRVATMFRAVGGDAANVIAKLTTARADTELGVKNAMAVLDFEAWSRGMRSESRALIGRSRKAAGDMEERGAPKAVGFYRPRAGESLYAISRRFYGTPHSWRLIADRNGLSSLRLDGTERLIIPERGEG